MFCIECKWTNRKKNIDLGNIDITANRRDPREADKKLNESDLIDINEKDDEDVLVEVTLKKNFTLKEV